MTDAKHTPEPWEAVIDPCDFHQKSTLADAHGNIIAQFGGTGPHVANTARAAACVNACAGMADPAAEIAEMRAKAQGMDLLIQIVQAMADTTTEGQPTTEALLDKVKENMELRAENARLRRYVGDEMIRSDFKTAAQMRSQLEHYRNEVIALRRNEAEAIDAIKAVGYTTPHGESDSLGEAVAWLVAEAERLRARVRELEEAARGICTAFTEDIDGNLRFGGREIVTQAVRAVCKAYRKERAS